MLHNDIQKDMQEAMRTKQALRLSVLRMALSTITNALIEEKKKPSDIADDALTIKILKRLMKQRRVSAAQYREIGKEEMASQEMEEEKILGDYLPPELSREEILGIVNRLKSDLQITDRSDKGILMKHVMQELKGRADGKTTMEIVDSVLK